MVTSVMLFVALNSWSAHETVTETSLSPSRVAWATPSPERSMNVTVEDQSKFLLPMGIVTVEGVQLKTGLLAVASVWTQVLLRSVRAVTVSVTWMFAYGTARSASILSCARLLALDTAWLYPH